MLHALGSACATSAELSNFSISSVIAAVPLLSLSLLRFLSSSPGDSRSRSFHREAEDLEGLRQWLSQQHTHADPQTFFRLLHACGRLKALTEGKLLHALIREKGLHSDIVMANCILNMYGKCHSLQDARNVFDQIVDGDEVSWTSMIAIFAKHGLSRDAFDVFQRMQQAPLLCPNEVTFISVLIACNHSSFYLECNLVFALIIFHGYERHLSVLNAVVAAYTKCESVNDTLNVFERMAIRNVVSWTTMIKAFSELDEGKALDIFKQMLTEGVEANSVTHLTLLSVCSNSQSLAEAKRIHAVVAETGGITDVVLGSALVITYGQCGAAEEAIRVFYLLPQRNIITWNGMISVFTHNGLKAQAFQHFEKMQQEGIEPNSTSFTTVLCQCTRSNDLIEGRIVHTCGVQIGIDSNEVVGCALVEMYSKCGNLIDAHEHFKRLEKQNTLLWSFLIVAHAKLGHMQEVWTLFYQMQVEGVVLNDITYSGALSAFGEPALLAYGKMLHVQIRENLFEVNDVVGSSLVSMYGHCGDLDASQKVFEDVGDLRSLVMWNALISGYAQHGQAKECLEMFRLMLREDVVPNSVSFSCILSICADFGFCKHSERLYGFVIECGLETDIIVESATINMYGKCGRLEDALWLFRRASVRGLIAWNSIIAAHALHGHFEDVLFYYEQMNEEGVKPSEVTFTVMLEGCSKFEEGKMIHHLIIQNELELMPIVCNALLSTYGNCGTLQAAQNVFNRAHKRNLISWNIMTGLHAKYLHFEEVFRLFHMVHLETIDLDKISLIHALSACTSLAALDEGKMVYGYAIDMGVHTDAVFQSALVSMFGKCGQINDARHVFYMMQDHDVISCTTMIVTYVEQNLAEDAFQAFQFMQEKGIEPSGISFASILSACSHVGLVDLGCSFFMSLINFFGIVPTFIHFSCLLNLFGRSGQLDRAEALINKIPMQPVTTMWVILIGSCGAPCDIDRGKRLASCLFQLKQPCDATYSLLSGMYVMEDEFSYNSAALSENLIFDARFLEQQRFFLDNTDLPT